MKHWKYIKFRLIIQDFFIGKIKLSNNFDSRSYRGIYWKWHTCCLSLFWMAVDGRFLAFFSSGAFSFSTLTVLENSVGMAVGSSTRECRTLKPRDTFRAGRGSKQSSSKCSLHNTDEGVGVHLSLVRRTCWAQFLPKNIIFRESKQTHTILSTIWTKSRNTTRRHINKSF